MRQEFGRVEQLRPERHSVTAIRVFFVAPRLIAYRPALGRIVDAPGRLRVCFEPALSWLGHLLGLAKRIKAAPPAASTQPSARTKRQPRQNGLPGTSHGAPPSRGGPPRGHSARRLPSMHEIPGRDLGEPRATRPGPTSQGYVDCPIEPGCCNRMIPSVSSGVGLSSTNIKL